MCWGRYELREEQEQEASEHELDREDEQTEAELDVGEGKELTPAGRQLVGVR